MDAYLYKLIRMRDYAAECGSVTAARIFHEEAGRALDLSDSDLPFPTFAEYYGILVR